jgi:hypothetical protein
MPRVRGLERHAALDLRLCAQAFGKELTAGERKARVPGVFWASDVMEFFLKRAGRFHAP